MYVDPMGLYECAPGVNCDFTEPMKHALQCYDSCTGEDTVITGGKGSRSKPNSSHSKGEACDIDRSANPDISPNEDKQCHLVCFPEGYGQEEQNKNKGTHYHHQLHTVPGGTPGYSPTVRPYTP